MRIRIVPVTLVGLMSVAQAATVKVPRGHDAPCGYGKFYTDREKPAPLVDHPLRHPSICRGPEGMYYLTGTDGTPAASEQALAKKRAAMRSEQGDWPMYRCDARRSGHAATPGAAHLALRWTADIGGELTAPAERRILDDGQLESAWPFDGSLLVEDGLVAAGGRLYRSEADGSMHCFAAAGAATRP